MIDENESVLHGHMVNRGYQKLDI